MRFFNWFLFLVWLVIIGVFAFTFLNRSKNTENLEEKAIVLPDIPNIEYFDGTPYRNERQKFPLYEGKG